MPKGAPADFSRTMAMIMLGGVPIMVIRPPRIEPKDNGMRITAGDCLALLAALMATGMSRARAPTLFMIADRAAPRPARAAMWSDNCLAARVT